MNRYNLQKRPKLFLPGCTVQLSQIGRDYIHRQSRIHGGFTLKFYREKFATIISINDKGQYVVIWENKKGDWKSSPQIWDGPQYFVHFKPRPK